VSNDTVGTYQVAATRELTASPERAWQAWSDPELVRQWWGPIGFSCSRADIDFREGGRSLVSMQAAEEYGGMLMHNSWTYTHIAAPARLEFVLSFIDERGDVIDPAGLGLTGVPRDVRHVVTLRPTDAGRTELTVTEYGYSSTEARDLSQAGLEQSLDKMQAIFAS
jgi:uncharacterized protein YndB with AHSA1/START domain